MGLGRQEEFYSCADIEIVALEDGATLSPITPPVGPVFTRTTILTTTPSADDVTGPGLLTCLAIGGYFGNQRMDWWCYVNCRSGYCPQTHCSPACKRLELLDPNVPIPPPPSTTTIKTTTTVTTTTTEASPTVPLICIGVGEWENDTSMAEWCRSNCESDHCPRTHCLCSKEGSLIDGSLSLGSSCKTVLKDITDKYRKYMDLWCKHNCPMFGCWNIPHICKC